jgi:hypothetical protein
MTTTGSDADQEWGDWGNIPSPHVSHEEILNATEVIDTIPKAKEAVSWIWTCRDQSQVPGQQGQLVIAVDLEGVHLGKGGYATLIQIATNKRNVFVFDIQSEPGLVDIVKPLLTSTRVVKVFHDCKADTYALMELGIDLANVFDTAVAHVVIQLQDQPDKVPVVPSLNKVVELYGDGRTNGEKDVMKDVYRYQYDLWSVRPLSLDMLVYASADVYCLVPDVYRNMRKKIRAETQNLLDRMIWESMMCHINKAAVKASKKQRKKRKEADAFAAKIDAATTPMELDSRDITLLHLINLTPERLEKIQMNAFVERTIKSIRAKNGGTGRDDEYLPSVSEAKRDAELQSAVAAAAGGPAFQFVPSVNGS